MSVINLGNPFQMTDAVLTLGTDSYQKLVSTAKIDNNPTSSEFRAISGDTYTLAGKASYTASLTFAQDWETTGSLCLYLWENEDTKVSMTLTPQTGGASFSGTVTLHAPTVGGDVNTPAVATVTLEFDGKPTMTPHA
jgi:hypothetical protein